MRFGSGQGIGRFILMVILGQKLNTLNTLNNAALLAPSETLDNQQQTVQIERRAGCQDFP